MAESFFRLEGIDDLTDALKSLGDRVGVEIALPAVKAGTVEGAKLIREAAPTDKPSIAATVGEWAQAQEGGALGKMGAGVGRDKVTARRSTTKGVGISAANVHWWVLGTKDRFNGVRNRRNGQRPIAGRTKRFTGRMPAHPLTKPAVMSGQDRIHKAMVDAAIAAVQEATR